MSKDSRDIKRDTTDSTHEEIRETYDWSTITPSTAVIETVAFVLDRDSTELDPLFEAVETDALDGLVRANGIRARNGRVTVSFTYHGYLVLVHSDGTVVTRTLE